MRQLLSGINVVELAEGIAGSYCGKLFADLGADVLKVEASDGDELRHRESVARDADGLFRGGAFVHLNTNKRSTVVDPGAPDGRERLERLVDGARLVIEETGRGRLRTWGMTWNGVHERWPRLSVVSISGFGATGPYAEYAWSDLVVQAMSDALVRPRSDDGPVRLPGHLGLHLVGNMAALGALAAVLSAESSGAGCFVDCAALEALATLPARATTLLAHQYRDGAPGPSLVDAARETLIPGGVHPCADGYVAMMSTPQQLGQLLDVLDDDALRAAFARPDAFERGETKEAMDAALYPWLLARTRARATAEAQRGGWPLAGVNSPSEVLEADHLAQRGFWRHTDDPAAGAIDLPGPPCRLAEGGWSLRRLAPGLGQHDDEAATWPGGSPQASPAQPSAAPGPTPPLSGIRIIDMTTVWSGPYATLLLADLGAEVIRVENPWVLPPTTKGYEARPTIANLGFFSSMYGPGVADRPDRPWNRHAMNNSLARNKLSCTIDTRRPEGRELLLQLADHSDVFIDNFRAGGLSRIGLHASELQARNPRLVVVQMPATGLTGEWAGYTGFGAQFDGLTGMLWLCGPLDSELMTSPGTTYMDAASGPGAAFAVMAALRYRQGTGRGQFVEFDQSENILNHLGDVFVDCQLGVAPRRWGNRDPWRAPQGLYRCRGEEQWLAISVRDDAAWRALAGAMGQEELGRDPRFAEVAARREHHDELDEIIGAWAAGQSPYDAFHTLQRDGVAAGPLLDDEMFGADPHLRDRDWQRPLRSLDVGTHLHPGLPYRGVPQAWQRGSPVLGEDNEFVYKQILGISDEAFECYRRDKILADDYLDPQGEPY